MLDPEKRHWSFSDHSDAHVHSKSEHVSEDCATVGGGAHQKSFRKVISISSIVSSFLTAKPPTTF
jgi:hypothetical protein